ncbi:hypothetical protein DE146DRAFT_170752 [Phaeosphaeria sp. MPI-PUGE-AT-0046c]|nr:hypothetical protein DE146DRAFT_170752 [Phaeosphaeria sp. MPI-PUGE-AT-0046c]
MRIEICLTLRGEPFPHLELQDLIQSILQAPVWPQLKLRPTIPDDVVPNNGVAHIVITSSDDDKPSAQRTYHRILDNVTYTDVQPPESFPKIQLQAVRFSMDILDAKQRPQLKRSTTSQDGHPAHSQQDAGKSIQENVPDVLLHQSVASVHGFETANETHQFSVNSQTNTCKRRRSQERIHGQAASSSAPAQVRKLRQCQGLGASLTTSITRSTPPSREELPEIEMLVERAMRLSITGTSKPSSRVKIKANTFFESLSDIAPVLWKPGYLAILAQQARLLPTIGRSLGNAVATRASSVSLKQKLKRLDAEPAGGVCGTLSWQCSPAASESEELTTVIIERSWLHLQTSLMARSTPTLHALVSINAGAAECFNSDEILEHSIVHDVSNGTAPCFENEACFGADPRTMQNEDRKFRPLTVETHAPHDAVASGTRTDCILERDPSAAARERHNKGSKFHQASMTAQSGSQDERFHIRQSISKWPSRSDNRKNTNSPASHCDQSLTTGGIAGHSHASVDDLLFEA